MATHSVFFSAKSHGQRSLEGYNPWDHRVRYDWACIYTAQYINMSVFILYFSHSKIWNLVLSGLYILFLLFFNINVLILIGG